MQKTAAILLTTALLSMVGPNAYAAQKKKTPPAHIVKGTTQLSGENAQLGVTYTLGKQNPFNITLKSAEYSIEPVVIGNSIYTVKEDEKFLIMHFVYHNPMHENYFVRWDTFRFTVVDSSDQNHDGLTALGAEADHTDVSMDLKPAQKKEVMAVMIVPAKSEMPKLIIGSGDDLVLRYDLRGKVKGLPATYADPADKSGATALDTVNVKLNTPYSIGTWSIKVAGAQIISERQIGEAEADEDGRFCAVTFSIKNISPNKEFFRWDTLGVKLVDTDDVELDNSFWLFRATSAKSFENDIPAGKEFTLRYIFKIKNDTTPKALKLTSARTFNFDLGEVK